MLEDELADSQHLMRQAETWFGLRRTLVASTMGRGHSCVVTDFMLQGDGFERLLVPVPSGRYPDPCRLGRAPP